MAEQNQTKLVSGFFICLGLVLFGIALGGFIGSSKFNASAIFFGLVMFYFAYNAKNKKESK